MDVDLEAIQKIAVSAALDAGRYQLGRVSKTHDISSKAHANDLVTEVDTASERMIVEMLSSERQDDGILGEEGANRESATGYRWVIDPLDGTRNFITRTGNWSVLIAYCKGDEPLVGVCYDAQHDELYTAIDGQGAYLNGDKIAVSDCDDMRSALMGVTLESSALNKRKLGNLIAGMADDIGDFRRLATGNHLTYAAAGRLDCGLVLDVKAWDVMAGVVIAREAGAWVGNQHAGEFSPACTLVATPKIAEEFRRKVAAFI